MAQTPNLLITEIDANQNQKEVTCNTAFVELEAAMTDIIQITMSDADYTLGAGEGSQALANLVFQFFGTITAERNIILPNNKKLYLVQNATELSFGLSIVVKTSAGTGVTIQCDATKYQLLYCDGTNVVNAGFSAAGTGTVTNNEGSLTANELLIGNGVSDCQVLGSLGTSGQVLVSQGSSLPPVWEDLPTPVPNINTQTTDYSALLTDANGLIRMNDGSANNMTVSNDSTTDFPVGTSLTVRQVGAGTTTIVADGGVTITSPSTLSLRVQYSTVQLIKVASNTWDLMGDVA